MFVGIDLSITNPSKGGGGPTYDVDATALFARFTTPPDDARKLLISNRITSLKAAGVWSVLDCDYVTAAADSQAARQNWKQDLYNLTAIASPAFVADRGYTSDGVSSYLQTGFIPSSAGGAFTQNSAHLCVYSRSAGINAGTAIGARTASTTNQSLLIPRASTNAATGRLTQAANGAGFVNSDGSGHFILNRENSAGSDLYRNGLSLGNSAVASDGPPSVQIYILALNNAGALAAGNTYQISIAGIGAGLTAAQAAAKSAIDLTYLQAVGAA